MQRSRPEARNSARSTALRLVFVVNFLAFVGVNAARVVLSLYALSLGASASTVGTVVAMLYVLPLFLSWPIGVLSDRVGAKWLLLAGVGSSAVGMLAPFFVRALPSMYLAAALVGLTIAFVAVLGQNLVGMLSKPEERTLNFSNFSLVGSLCNFVGPLLAGFSIDHFGHAAASLAVTAVALVAVCLVAIWGGSLPGSRPAAGPRADIRKTLGDRSLRRVLSISSISQLGFDVFQSFLPIYGHGIGLSASAIGIVLAAMAVGSFAIRAVMPRLLKRLGEEKLLSAAFCFGVFSSALLPFTRSVPALSAIAAIFGMFVGCSQPLTMMLMYSQSEEGRAGEALGLRLTVNNISRIIGPAVFGALGSAFGLLPVFWINAVLMGSGGKLSYPRGATDRGKKRN